MDAHDKQQKEVIEVIESCHERSKNLLYEIENIENVQIYKYGHSDDMRVSLQELKAILRKAEEYCYECSTKLHELLRETVDSTSEQLIADRTLRLNALKDGFETVYLTNMKRSDDTRNEVLRLQEEEDRKEEEGVANLGSDARGRSAEGGPTRQPMDTSEPTKSPEESEAEKRERLRKEKLRKIEEGRALFAQRSEQRKAELAAREQKKLEDEARQQQEETRRQEEDEARRQAEMARVSSPEDGDQMLIELKRDNDNNERCVNECRNEAEILTGLKYDGRQKDSRMDENLDKSLILNGNCKKLCVVKRYHIEKTRNDLKDPILSSDDRRSFYDSYLTVIQELDKVFEMQRNYVKTLMTKYQRMISGQETLGLPPVTPLRTQFTTREESEVPRSPSPSESQKEILALLTNDLGLNQTFLEQNESAVESIRQNLETWKDKRNNSEIMDCTDLWFNAATELVRLRLKVKTGISDAINALQMKSYSDESINKMYQNYQTLSTQYRQKTTALNTEAKKHSKEYERLTEEYRRKESSRIREPSPGFDILFGASPLRKPKPPSTRPQSSGTFDILSGSKSKSTTSVKRATPTDTEPESSHKKQKTGSLGEPMDTSEPYRPPHSPPSTRAPSPPFQPLFPEINFAEFFQPESSARVPSPPPQPSSPISPESAPPSPTSPAFGSPIPQSPSPEPQPQPQPKGKKSAQRPKSKETPAPRTQERPLELSASPEEFIKKIKAEIIEIKKRQNVVNEKTQKPTTRQEAMSLRDMLQSITKNSDTITETELFRLERDSLLRAMPHFIDMLRAEIALMRSCVTRHKRVKPMFDALEKKYIVEYKKILQELTPLEEIPDAQRTEANQQEIERLRNEVQTNIMDGRAQTFKHHCWQYLARIYMDELIKRFNTRVDKLNAISRLVTTDEPYEARHMAGTLGTIKAMQVGSDKLIKDETIVPIYYARGLNAKVGAESSSDADLRAIHAGYETHVTALGESALPGYTSMAYPQWMRFFLKEHRLKTE